ncbi:MAG: hypothetical protein C0505_06475 [Leptothrix sp. (in: Bacteria)]|nr:hypothetical protein [Leptothrix sp. (in: b-proteobacteria)]
MKFGNLIKVAVGTLAVATAHAAPLYYFGNAPTASGGFPPGCPAAATNCDPSITQGLFTDAVAVTMSETFENIAAGSLGSSSLGVFGASGSGLSQATPVPGTLDGGAVQSGTAVSGRFNTTSGAATGRWFESDYGFTIQLAGDVGAFGFYGTDFNDFAGSLEIELFDGAQSVFQNVFTQSDGSALPLRTGAAAVQDGSLIFFGFASDTVFDRIVFRIGQPSGIGLGDQDYLGFDDIIVGNLRTTTPPNPAPEPGSLALVGLALFAAGWARKAQRRT